MCQSQRLPASPVLAPAFCRPALPQSSKLVAPILAALHPSSGVRAREGGHHRPDLWSPEPRLRRWEVGSRKQGDCQSPQRTGSVSIQDDQQLPCSHRAQHPGTTPQASRKNCLHSKKKPVTPSPPPTSRSSTRCVLAGVFPSGVRAKGSVRGPAPPSTLTPRPEGSPCPQSSREGDAHP